MNSLFDVDGIGGEVPNRKNGLNFEDETDEMGKAQERSKEEVGPSVGNIYECESGDGSVGERSATWTAERRMSF